MSGTDNTKKWNDLSMAERASYIKLAVENGVTDLSQIRDTYNKYAEGGDFSAGAMTDALYKSAEEVESLGYPAHNYDFTQSEEWANAHGYYPDERGHRDDRVKKPSHPTHPSRGTWNGMNEFQLTDKGMEDPNYTMFGMADGGQDPQATLTYAGAIVLPELTVTPRGNYIHNSYDNLNIWLNRRGGEAIKVNKFDDGGDRLISTGNEYTDIGLSFVPFVGSAMDIEEAIRNPTFGNIAFAVGSTVADFFGGSLIKGAVKGGARAARATNAVNRTERATKAYNRAVHNVTVNPTRGTRKQARRTFQEAQAAKAELRSLTRESKRGGVRRIPQRQLIMPSDNTRVINPYTVYGTDFIINAIQQGSN